ncbi:MAG: lipopolysaccharide biosynthesis protein [Candidatus Electrothrix sp. AR3]|nr:lipopolysaccharide biosynthesis protein [Candidatus Electrothrix sp. AR3]
MLKSFLWNTFGNISNLLIQTIVLIFINHLEGLEKSGYYALAFSVATPLFNFGGMQIRSIIATDIHKKFNYFEYRNNITINNLACFLLALTSFFFNFDQDFYFCLFALCLLKVLENYSDIHYGFFQRKKHIKLVGYSLVFKNILAFILMYTCYLYDAHLYAIVLSFLLSRLFGLLVDKKLGHGLSFKEGESSRFQKKSWSRMFNLTFPLGIMVSVVAINNSLPRFFLEMFTNTEVVAIFSTSISMLLLIITISNSLGQFYTINLSKSFAQNMLKEFFKIILFMELCILLCGSLLFIFISFFSEKISFFLFRISNVNFDIFLQLMVIAVSIQSANFILGFVITSIRWFRSHAILQLWIVLLTAVTQFISVKKLGLIGSAYALICTAALQTLSASVLIIYCTHKTHPNFLTDTRQYAKSFFKNIKY